VEWLLALLALAGAALASFFGRARGEAIGRQRLTEELRRERERIADELERQRREATERETARQAEVRRGVEESEVRRVERVRAARDGQITAEELIERSRREREAWDRGDE
jgi:uncharacterized protein YdaU (DUF1376 family)